MKHSLPQKNWFFLLLLGIFSVNISANTLKIDNFPGYEFYKYNFSYYDNQDLNTSKQPSQPPVFSLSFVEHEIFELKNKNIPVQWGEGISGKAPRFYGNGSEYPLFGWDNFFSRDRLSSFTLSFYFLPQTVMREENLFEGVKENSQNQTMYPTEFRVQLRNGYVHWDLKNFFISGIKKYSRSLKSQLPFQPGEWNHLVLGYDIKNARFTMTLNGELVDFSYATVDDKKNGPQYTAGFYTDQNDFDLWTIGRGNKSNPAIMSSWVMGKGFTGMIDEVALFDDYIQVSSPFQPNQTSKVGDDLESYYSVYASRVFRLGKDTQINLAEIHGENIDKSFIRFFLCQSQDFFPEHINFSDCNRVHWDKKIIGYPQAEFYQFFLVYNNLEHSLKSVSSLEISYIENNPPLPPQWVTMEQSRDGLLLEWKQTLEEIEGYRIYFRPNDFQGEKSMIQLSIDELEIFKNRQGLWTYIMEGLEKDNLYFFGIKSFDFYDGRVRESDFSHVKNIYYSSEFFN